MMSMVATPTLIRERYNEAPASPAQAAHAERLLKLLLAQNGSTTRLCETLAGGPVELNLLHQSVTTQVPDIVRRELPGSRFLERITCLTAHGRVMTDNLVYIALEGLDARLQRDLGHGTEPIGHLLASSFVHRRPLVLAAALQDPLWRAVGLPDSSASRAYGLATAQGLHMVIVETFRHGMLLNA